MALGDLMASRLSGSSPSVSHHLDEFSGREDGEAAEGEREQEAAQPSGSNFQAAAAAAEGNNMAYLTQTVVLSEFLHEGFEDCTEVGPSDNGLVSKWRPKDRLKTGCVALVLCLNIGVNPPDVIKISPCAQMECWIDPHSMAAPKALETIGKALHAQYECWQRRQQVRYKLQLDPTVEEVKKLCNTCRKYAKSERVLFHYNGHGVPKPTANGEIWVFNKSYTQYIPLPINELNSWLKTPSIYVFDCSAAGMIVKAFLERQDWNTSAASGFSSKDFIMLAACEAHETLPQSVEFPADVFTSCLTTPIKMALRWFSSRSLLHDSLNYSLIDQIPGLQNERKTLLGELNWIFTAVTDTIAWNVLPHDLFQRLFRQDLLVASLFRNFLLAERIMRAANCSPVSYPLLPPTHQHHMWDAWDMAAEICLSKLPQLIANPNADFQPSPFFTEQLTAFEVWLDHGSKHKKPPEQLPIVLQVLLSQSHRFHALVLLGRFLDMGPWAVDLALSVGIFPYVLKLLQTTATELRQILVFIWTKILALDKSCQVDLVKDGGHTYFIRFLDSMDAYAEQRAMAAFVLAVVVDGHRRGQEACIQANLINVCLKHLQIANPSHGQTEPLLLQWLCLCLGKLWEDFPEAQIIGSQADGPATIFPLLLEPQPEVRASAVFALGTLIDVASVSFGDGHRVDEDFEDDEKIKSELNIIKNLLQLAVDGSPLVRAEVAVALARFAFSYNKPLKLTAAENWKPLSSLPSLASINHPNSLSPSQFMQSGRTISHICPVLRGNRENSTAGREGRISKSSPIASVGIMYGSPLSDDSSHSDSGILAKEIGSNGVLNCSRVRPFDNALCSQFTMALCNMAKDPSPRVANLARRALSIIGIELVVTKAPRLGIHPGDSSVPSRTSNLPGLARSSSWFDLNAVNAGQISVAFRTPPVSPPRQNYMAGLRRVCSLEFRPHQLNSPDTGLADPLLGTAGLSGGSERSLLPQSTIYNWSCGHFSRPLPAGTDDNEETISRREERERIALDCMVKCRHSSNIKLSNQIASWDTKFETGTKASLLLPFSPIVVAADENEQIRVWNYEEATSLNNFDNYESSDRGISKLSLVNELDDSLLLVASSDGNVRFWKNFTVRGKQKLVTAFSSVPGHRSAARGTATVVDWQQQSGYLYASSDTSPVLIWDLDKEQLVSSIPSSSDNCISALSASQVHSGQFAAGFIDGTIRIYDIRTPEMLVCTAQPHTQVEKVVGIGFQPGLDPTKIVSASLAGDIQFLDFRNQSEPYLTFHAHRGSLTALAIHRHAPIIASGSAKQVVKVFSLKGEQLGTIRYYPTFMAQRIGSVSCLTFHPYKVLLSIGAVDACVSIYADDSYQTR
ncbi:regulatory-associated protein of TOR 1-like isoform X1 [Curcuma longa]|uniref:regulatory-associated protein of TOR 1-like isoform X1 n=2 Tax=Curcuma longa TaxID=136217 RepID=UPI003D9E10BF